MFGLII